MIEICRLAGKKEVKITIDAHNLHSVDSKDIYLSCMLNGWQYASIPVDDETLHMLKEIIDEYLTSYQDT